MRFMKTYPFLLMTTVVLLVSCHSGGHPLFDSPEITKQLVATQYLGVYRSEGICQRLDKDTISGYSIYYFIPKPDSINPREWADSAAYVNYLKEHSPEELSQWFDIYMCHVIKIFLKTARELNYSEIINISTTGDGMFTFYQLNFQKKEMVKIKQFNNITLSVNNTEAFNQWFAHFMEEKTGKTENVIEEKATNWIQNQSVIDDYSLDNLKSEETLRNIQWFDIPELFKKNPLSKENVAVFYEASCLLMSYKMYNEARLILLEIVEEYPDWKEASLELAAATKAAEEN